MNITKAVITAAGRRQRTLPLQTLIDRDGVERSVLHILLNEVVQAGIDAVAVIVSPGDEEAYAAVAGDHVGRLHFLPQREPLGYGDALYTARAFVGDDPFLHLVGDHLYVQGDYESCAQRLIEAAQAADCTVSAVQATRESLLPYFGAVGGRRIGGHSDLYRVDTVMEKPTPTVAEQHLLVPGLRAGHYLCFFGMHVLTPTVMEILGRQLVEARGDGSQGDGPQTGNLLKVTLSSALSELIGREQYLALEQQNSRYDLGVRYGLLSAQMALALNGRDRDEVLARLLELLAQRDLAAGR
jgi:UTP--glucose-1-phosphate uridylyltransferase